MLIKIMTSGSSLSGIVLKDLAIVGVNIPLFTIGGIVLFAAGRSVE